MSKQVIEFHVVENGKSLLRCTSCKSLKSVTFHNVDQLHSAATSDKQRPDLSPDAQLHITDQPETNVGQQTALPKNQNPKYKTV